MPEQDSPNPFINGANKTAYYFSPGMTLREAIEALFDHRRHLATDETHVCESGEIYRVVRVSPRDVISPELFTARALHSMMANGWEAKN